MLGDCLLEDFQGLIESGEYEWEQMMNSCVWFLDKNI